MNIQTVNHHGLSFVNVTTPGELDIKYLKNNFGFSALHLDDYMNKTQVPKIEVMKDYTLVVLDFPFIDQDTITAAQKKEEKTAKTPIESLLSISSATFSPVPIPPFISGEKKRRILASQVDIFIGKAHVVILHEGVLHTLNDIFTMCQKTLRNRTEFMDQGSVFLSYRIIDALVDSCFPVMNELTTTIDKIDKELAGKQSQTTVEHISITRRNIVVFQTMIKPILPLFKQLEDGHYKELNGMMQQFWGNVVDHLQKIWDRLEDSRELIEGISESNESLLTYRNNEIVKFLTVITSISFPFVIVNNLYSMNVAGLPYATHPWIVWVLFGIIFLVGVLIILYFKYRSWI